MRFKRPIAEKSGANKAASSSAPHQPVRRTSPHRNLSHLVQRAADNPAQLSPDDILQLQRMLGNQAVQQMLTDVDRPATGRAKGVNRQSMAARSTTMPIIQRAILWNEGARTKTVDLVNTITNFQDFGVTPAKINAEEFPGGDATTAIATPTFVSQPKLGGDNKIIAKIVGEPINIVGYRMELPANAPWQRNVSRAKIVSAIEMLAADKFDAQLGAYKESDRDQIQLRVKGMPNDAGFAKLVETHENQHVKEIKAGVKKILKPWDKTIKQFVDAEVPIEANDLASAQEAFYSAAGGTPEEVGEALVDDFKERGVAYHHTDEGSSPSLDHLATTGDQSSLSVYWKHPLG